MTGRIRVAHVITKLAVGGAQESALMTLTGLPGDEFDQWLVSGTEVDEEGSLRGDVLGRGVRLVEAPALVRLVRPRLDRRAVLELRDHLRAERPDIVHTHSSKAGLVGRAAARLAGVPTVVHSVHGWSFHDEMGRLARAGVVAAERLAARSTDALVHEGTPDRAKGLAQGIGRPEQYILIRNGIDLGRLTEPGSDRAAVRAGLGVPSDAWLIGTVGRLADQKHPIAMVESVAPLMADDPDVWFVWVGDGSLRADVERRAQELGIGDRFRLVGLRRDVPAVLGALDTFALSSLWEGLPRTVTEAMAAGVPVVATAVDGVAEAIVDEEHGLLVAPHDRVALAAGLRRVRSDHDLRSRLVDAARVRSQEFDVGEMNLRVAALYRGLVAGRSVADIAADPGLVAARP